MKKIAGKISWLIAIASAAGAGISWCFREAFAIWLLCLAGLLAGIVGILIFSPETRKNIINLLDFF